MNRLTVKEFAVQVEAGDTPVTVRRGPKTVGEAKNLINLAKNGSPEILASKITFVTIERDGIIIQVR